MRRFTTTTRRRPQMLHVRRWAVLLNVPLMQFRFVLATNDRFAHLKDADYLVETEAHRVAAVARKCS